MSKFMIPTREQFKDFIAATKKAQEKDKQVNYDRLREMIDRCEWKFAKTMPFAPHEGWKGIWKTEGTDWNNDKCIELFGGVIKNHYLCNR